MESNPASASFQVEFPYWGMGSCQSAEEEEEEIGEEEEEEEKEDEEG